MTPATNTPPTDFEQACLEWQHQVMVRLTNNALLPDSIQQYLTTVTSPKIADVGTGSGIWLKDLAGHLPSTSQLTGFDIDTSKFPPPRSMARNISLLHGNILEPFPDHLLGTYDLVHVRFLIFNLKASDWVPAARNLRTLLKPDGYVFWEEAGYPSWITIPPSRAWYELLDCAMSYAKSCHLDVTSPIPLPTHIKTANYTSIHEKNFHTVSVPALNTSIREAFTRGWAQKAYGIVSRGGVEGLRTNAHARELLMDLERDFEGGVLAAMELKWVWGRRGG